MTDYSDYSELPPSSSPGLPPLPAQGGGGDASDESAGISLPTPTTQLAPVTDLSTPATPSLNLPAPSRPLMPNPRADDDAAYLKSLPTTQKIGLAMQAFGNAVNGQPDPIRALLAQRSKSRQDLLTEIDSTLKTVDAGMTMARQISDPKAKAALAEQIDRAVGLGGDTIKNAILGAGTGDESAIRSMADVITDPAGKDMLVKAAMQANPANPRQAALKLLTDSDFMKKVEKTVDLKNLPTAMSAVNVMGQAMAHDPQFQGPDGKPKFGLSDLIAANQKLPPEQQLPQSLIDTVSRNQSDFIRYGLQTSTTQQQQQADEAKKNDTFHTNLGKLNADRAAGHITPEQYAAGVKSELESKANKVIIQQQTIDKNASGDANTPGGAGAEMLQDRDSGVKYSVNTKTGKAWKMGDDGNWASINPNDVPANASKVGAGASGQAGREAVFTQRILQSANQAAGDLENVAKLPLSSSTGIFGGRKQGAGLMDATKEVLANTVTSQEAQSYAVKATGFQRNLASIEAAGLMPSGSLTHQLDAVIWKEGDTNLTKLQKLAQTRQIIDNGLDAMSANPRISDQEKQKMQEVRDKVAKAVPFTHDDLDRLQAAQTKNPNATLKDVMLKAGTVKGGYRFKGGDPADKANWDKVS